MTQKRIALVTFALSLVVLTGCTQIGDFLSGFVGSVNSESLERADRMALEVKDLELTVLTQIEPMKIEYLKIVSAARKAEADRDFPAAMKLFAAGASLKEKIADLYERLRTKTDPLVASVNEIREEHNRRSGSAWYRIGGTAGTLGLLAFGIYRERKGRKAAESGHAAETNLFETVLRSVDLLGLNKGDQKILSDEHGRRNVGPEIDERLNIIRAEKKEAA